MNILTFENYQLLEHLSCNNSMISISKNLNHLPPCGWESCRTCSPPSKVSGNSLESPEFKIVLIQKLLL